MKNIELIDRGFNSDFSSKRIEEFCSKFGSEKDLQNFIDRIHEEDHTYDMKRGEFYPEILRCIASLKRASANVYDIEPEQCHPNFGSNGNIDTILVAMKLREIENKINTDKWGGALDVEPTYFRNYNSCNSKKIKLRNISLNKTDWTFDIDTVIDAVKQYHPTIIILVTPNNPTGIAIPDKSIIKVIEEAPDDTVIMMDRTLVNIESEINTIELLKKYKEKQLVILHSFSKYAGMSHLRIGISLYSNKKLAEEVRPLLPLGLNVEGCIKATKLILEKGQLTPSIEVVSNIKENKKILTDFCNWSQIFSCTNFVSNYCLLFLPQNLRTDDVVKDLEKKYIYTMGGEEFPNQTSGMIRLHSGGHPEYMRKTVEALTELYL